MKKREIARKDKKYKESDDLRDFIFKKGFLVEDTPKGSMLKNIKE